MYLRRDSAQREQTQDRVLIHVDTGKSELLVNNHLAYVSVSRAWYDAHNYRNYGSKLSRSLRREDSQRIATEVEQQLCCAEDRIGRRASCVIRRGAANSSRSSNDVRKPPTELRSADRNYPALACTAWRVASRVLMRDSLGSFLMIGSMAHPNPNGTSRVSEMARHSTTPPALRSSSRQ